MIVRVSGGEVTMVYTEALDLSELGRVSITRASYVEPTPDGEWTAEMLELAGGPAILGPFATRSEALRAEGNWIEHHLIRALGVDP